MGIKLNFLKKYLKSRHNLLTEGKEWLKVLFSLKGIWAFFPVLIAVGLVYIGHYHGVTEAQWESVWKNRLELTAVPVLSLTVALLIIAVLRAKKRIDIVFLGVSIAFLCREIHFAGTSTGVYIAVGIVAGLAFFWRDTILDELQNENFHKATIFALIWSYFVSLVIQRRAFSAKHLDILPDEQSVHIGLEEMTEDMAHIIFLLLAVYSLYLAFKNKIKTTNNSD